MADEIGIQGRCDARFARVREAFAENFRARDEIGAAVAIALEGELVVDLWAGHQDRERTRPWQRDTLVNVYSTTKGVTALAAHRLVDEGRLDLDAPVAKYWPEFAQAGKGALPVRWLLSHRAGLPAVRKLLPNEALYDWQAMTSALAAEAPWWEAGTAHGYHAVSFGWLVGEVVRCIAGKSLGAYLRDTFCGPLDLDLHVGLAEREHARVADILQPEAPEPSGEAAQLFARALADPEGVTARAFMNPPSMALGPNVPAWRSAEIPGANGHATARALAALYGRAALGDAGGVISNDAIARCRGEQSRGPDLVLGVPTRFGLGFMLRQESHEGGRCLGTGALGHPGAGGSLAFADPERRLGFGYVMNRMGPRILLDDRAIALVEAANACLGGRA
jgi:CubicO group peptidase (beta-lactamase class C family)